MRTNLITVMVLSMMTVAVSAVPASSGASISNITDIDTADALEATDDFDLEALYSETMAAGSLGVPDDINSTMPGLAEDPLMPGNIFCETSWASPTEHEINFMIVDIMNFKKKICRQTNGGGSKCKKIAGWKGGAVSMCGGTYNAPCYTVAAAVDHIRQKCRQGDKDRAGGKYQYKGKNHWVMLH